MSTVDSYDFLAPERIVFGWGRWPEVGPLAARLGKRAFLVLGSRTLAANGFLERLQAKLAEHQVRSVLLTTVLREPEIADVDDAARRIRAEHPGDGDLVLGVGGGSAIDLAKAVAALATNRAGESVKDYLEGIGRGLAISVPPLPMIAMPTTAGTGSEATKNAVISCNDPPVKKSLRSDLMVPRAVIIDPQLGASVPPAITAQTGMDAITQLIESYISRKSRPIPRALAVQGLRLALGAIEEAVASGQSRPAREDMAHAALLSGMALANSGLGMAHGVAAALGVHCGTAHGLACAVMLPIALAANRATCSEALGELAHAAGLGTNEPTDRAAERLIERIGEIGRALGLPRSLSEIGVTADQIPDLVRDSRGNSMDGNPRSLSDRELTQILEAAL